jgi:succinate dehydrogenase/fumarate reductase flavoprotein subunit
MLLLLACTGPDGTTPYAKPGGDTSGETGDTAETGDSGTHTGETGDTGDSYAERAVSDTVDVVIVGGGPAGLAAAIEADAAGASWVVLEREEEVGGAALWAGGLMMFAGSAEQEDAHIEDSAEDLLAEWTDITGGDPEDEWVQFFAYNHVAEVRDWLEGFGAGWSTPTYDPSAGTVARISTVDGGGPGLVANLHDQLDEGRIRYRAEAQDLVVGADGAIAGVAWHDMDTGEEWRVDATATVVATGGFMHNLERVVEERPDLAGVDLRYASWPGSDGNGLSLLEGYGAATSNLGAAGIYAHAAPSPVDDGDEVRVYFLNETAWLNVDAERFCNEDDTNSFKVGATRAVQPEGLVWAFADDVLVGDPSFTSAADPSVKYTLAELQEAGVAFQADTLAELAALVSLDTDAVEGTIGAFNDSIAGLEADPYREDAAPGTTIDTAPFHAFQVAASPAKAFGGIDTDLQGRVLDTSGAPIPGLYAAGELTGMAGGSLVGEYGFTGSLTAVVLSGRVAGASAAGG